jgi:hypothetical protein
VSEIGLVAASPVFNPLRNIGRNDPCPCGSGRKFKKCCLGKSEGADFSESSDSSWPFDEASDSSWALDPETAGYDPMIEPDATEWLALDEQQRIDLVEDYHERARISVPRMTAHAIIHVVVENQIAEGDTLPVKRTLQRLMAQGLDRHDAIHAIGFVLAGHLNELVREGKSDDANVDPNVDYFAELESLTAEEWRRTR